MDYSPHKNFFGGQKRKSAGEVKADLPAENAFQFDSCRMAYFPAAVIQNVLQQIKVLIFRVALQTTSHWFYGIINK